MWQSTSSKVQRCRKTFLERPDIFSFFFLLLLLLLLFLLLLLLWRFGSSSGHALTITRFLRQVYSHKVRISALRPTPNPQVQSVPRSNLSGVLGLTTNHAAAGRSGSPCWFRLSKLSIIIIIFIVIIIHSSSSSTTETTATRTVAMLTPPFGLKLITCFANNQLIFSM